MTNQANQIQDDAEFDFKADSQWKLNALLKIIESAEKEVITLKESGNDRNKLRRTIARIKRLKDSADGHRFVIRIS